MTIGVISIEGDTYMIIEPDDEMILLPLSGDEISDLREIFEGTNDEDLELEDVSDLMTT